MTLTSPDPKLRQRFASDYQRPTYHFLPPAHWMNDPNGLIQWKGQYHLFYQYNPHGAFHATMHWGHAVSDDLLHWRDLPIALTPTPHSPDEAGIFSGCAVNHDGVPTLIYTGVQGAHYEIQTQCIATSDDDLLTWAKYAGNPLIAEVPDLAGQTRDFRDPFVWREDDAWYMVVGSRIEGRSGVIFLYRSHDLFTWEYLNPLVEDNRLETDWMWECPNFFQLGDKHVLIVSAGRPNATVNVQYMVGTYANHRFVPETVGLLDYGYLYAPLTMLDDSGRRLLWGWVREGRTVEAQKAAGWSGVQSFPRHLTLTADGRLRMEPVAEIVDLRAEHWHLADVSLAGLSEQPVGGVDSASLEMVAVFEPGATGQCGLKVLASADGTEATRILYDADTQQLIVDREQSSLNADVDQEPQTAPHVLAEGEALELRILLDGSVIEIIANQRTSLTSRVYPTRADSRGVALIAQGSSGYLRRLDAWHMKDIWTER